MMTSPGIVPSRPLTVIMIIIDLYGVVGARQLIITESELEPNIDGGSDGNQMRGIKCIRLVDRYPIMTSLRITQLNL